MDNITIFWIIYSIGYILSYALCKYLRNKVNENTWKDVMGTIITSLFSWIMVTIILIMLLIEWINIIKPKPPKWM